MDSPYFDGLNAPQVEAVGHIKGPLLVLAGAGSGKTRVITHRIAHLVASGAAGPDQILAVTFTNKAAGEMKERVVKLLGPQARRIWLSTFHSFCARILRENAEILGFKRGFSIYDESESTALIKRIYKDLGIPDSQPSPGVTQSRISRAKDQLVTADEYASRAKDFIEVNISRIYREYQQRLARNQAMDFDDLLMKTVELFQREQAVLHNMHSRFKYILIDEYQDTNHAQYRLVNLLAEESRNICVVGDDDQSIYTWRGADISNILDFEKDYPEARVIKLEQNYRSTQNILDAAGDIVTKIPGRKSKKLFTDKEEGEKISLLLCGDEVDEAEAITEKIRLSMIYDKPASDFAILYRTNAQSRVLEDSLRYKAIPYAIVGGIKFYERAEVKDILAYLRLLVNPDDDLALRRIINVPRRGVGKTSIEKMERLADKKRQPLMSILVSSLDECEIAGKARKELEKFVSIMNDLSSRIDKLPPDDLAARLIEKIEYLDMLYNEGTPEADVRADNVKELVAGIAEYAERSESPTLAGFLEEVALITDIDTWDDSTPAVTLMTLHSAKGLEFDTVFISGMEDGLLPLQRSLDDRSDPDEERRLCYVGITRAKNKLYLTMAGFRRRWGDYTGGPSVFLRDIPEDKLEVERFNYWEGHGAPARSGKRDNFAKRRNYRVEIDESDMDDMLSEGAKVLHDKFGQGTIISREAGGEELMITVRFEKYGDKKLMARYANLEIIER